MGKEFFNGWALWEKMCFVLGCAIVATFIVALVKLKYDHYRIAKYTKVDKAKAAEPTPEMLEAAREEERQGEEIPFGIRAIESGIEVEGVWISRSNTPNGSSASSVNGEFRIPRSFTDSTVEPPRPAYASSSRDSSRAPSSYDRAVSAERLGSDYSGVTRNSTALYALEGVDSAGPSNTSRYAPAKSATTNSSDSNSPPQSRRTSDESDFMAQRPYEPAYIKPSAAQATLQPVDPRWDLDLLQSHRLSHVAETGQLTPRARKPASRSGDWTTADALGADEISSTAGGVNYFVPRNKTPSPPMLPLYEPSEDLSASVGTVYAHDGHAANQARQAMPLLDTYAPQTYAPQTYQPRGPQHMYEEEEYSMPRDQQYVVEPLQTQRQSQVLRKVNSGFEILRPGTFPAPPSPEEPTETQPLEKRQSRKLQKKRRSSDVSTKSAKSEHRKSHFIEQV